MIGLRRQLVGKEEQLSKFKKAVEDLKGKVVQLTVEREKDERECDLAKQNEAEMRRRVGGQEDRLKDLKEQVGRLTHKLDEQKELTNKEADKITHSHIYIYIVEACRWCRRPQDIKIC